MHLKKCLIKRWKYIINSLINGLKAIRVNSKIWVWDLRLFLINIDFIFQLARFL